MFDSDSDIEIVEPARPPAAAAATVALFHPTSPSAADPNLEPRPSQPVASSSKAPYTAGAWASNSGDKQPESSSNSSSAPRTDSALVSKKRNLLGGAGGSSNAGAAGERMQTSTATKRAQNGVDAKGKGRADVTVLSIDDDEDEDEPLVAVSILPQSLQSTQHFY